MKTKKTRRAKIGREVDMVKHWQEHVDYLAKTAMPATPGAFYSMGKEVFIGHVAIADGIDDAWAARVADALNYRKRSH